MSNLTAFQAMSDLTDALNAEESNAIDAINAGDFMTYDAQEIVARLVLLARASLPCYFGAYERDWSSDLTAYTSSPCPSCAARLTLNGNATIEAR